MPDMLSSYQRHVYVLVNAVVVLVVLLAVFLGLNWHQMPNGLGEFLAIRITVKNLLLTAAFLVAWATAFSVFGLAKPSAALPLWQELTQVTKACIVAAGCAVLFRLTSRSGAFTGRTIMYFLPTAIAACLSGRVLARICARRLIRTFGGDLNVIIVGSGPRATSLYEHVLARRQDHVRVLGFVDSPNCHSITEEVSRQMLGSLEEFEGIVMRHPVDEVLIALPAKSCYSEIQTAIRTCERAGVEAKYLSDIFKLSLARQEFVADEQAPVVSLRVVTDDYRLLIKRVIDIAGAVFGIIIFAPLMLMVVVAISLTSPGPVLFKQQRYGFHKRLFPMYKFRTMAPNSEGEQEALEPYNEAQGPVFKIRDDPRITSIGRILRTTSLDELPQFFNVLRGEMSLVGPRPLPIRDVSRFDDASLMRRFSVKPGLTGLWQVSGRGNTSFGLWIAQDLEYIDKWSLCLDLVILAKTVPAVLRRDGAG